MSADPSIRCPVVAIGVSVGGLDALEQLFGAMPVDTGMAFVIGNHSAPDHESHLAQRLAQYSAMPVITVSVEAVTRIVANQIYICAPGKILSVSTAGLQAFDATLGRSAHMPIDCFLNEVAESQRAASLAIILSGTGSDGIWGLKAIKAYGGMVMAQAPDSASHDCMPRTAIATGLIDCIATPAEMPELLVSSLCNLSKKLEKSATPGTSAGIDETTPISQFEEELAATHTELASGKGQLEEKTAELQLSYDYADTIVDTLREPFLVLDERLVVQYANRSFYEKFSVTPDETQNRLVYDLGNRQWDNARLRMLLEEILPEKNQIENFQVEHEFPVMGERSFLLNASQLLVPGEVPLRILLAFEDITELEGAKQLKRNAETFSRLVDESPFGIYVIDANFCIARISVGGRSAFSKVKPLIGRDFTEAIHILWSEELADEIVRHFRHTLDTGEPYLAPSLTAKRLDVGDVESYEWQIHRVTLPDGSYGVVCYFFDSSDIRAAEQAAHDSEQSARRANRVKSEFLAHVSHEIRTPMSAVLGYAELLLNQLKNSEFLHEVKIIKSSGESLLRLVDDLLDLSSIEAGKLQIEPDRCELDVLLAEVVSQVQMRAIEKRLNLTLDYAGDIPQSIETDAGRVQQILLNLLSNAIKFTDKGDICLRITYVALPIPTVRFDVTDTGIGMSESRQQKLFQPFERATKRDYGGTGLGLYISHRLAERLRGTLTVQSTLHRGSSFTLTLPADNCDTVTLVKPRKTIVVPKTIAELSAKLVDRHILIVDDQPAVRELLKQFVESASGKVTTVNNGQMALDTMTDHHAQAIDAIVLDLQMPIMDGLDTVRALRQRGHNMPIIAITANAMQSGRRQCLAAGFDAYMNKPIVGNALISRLHQLIEGSRQRRVLVVDDAPESADPLSRLLRIRGFDVQTVYSGTAVLAAVQAFSPDVLLLDISLPDMDGYQVADLIQQQPDSTGMELIALTGHNSESDQISIRNAGFKHHLVKPVDMDKLLTILQQES